MKNEKRVPRQFLLTLLFLVSLVSPAFAGKSTMYKKLTPKALNKISKELKKNLFEKTNTDFIVYFKEGAVFKETSSLKKMDEKKGKSSRARRRWKKSIKKVILANRVLKSFKNFPIKYIHVETEEEKINLLNNDNILFIGKNKKFKKTLRESLNMINQPDVKKMGHRGEGTSVAVLDTGINYMKRTFGKCSLAPRGNPYPGGNCQVVFAKDFSSEMHMGRFIPKDDGQLDDDNHGTNVAGIISKIAPKTKLISLDVFTKYKEDDEVIITASTVDIIRALDWVVENKEKYNIVAVNLSLGDDSNYKEDCSQDYYNYNKAFEKVIKSGIIPVVAAGNEGHANGVGAPACLKDAVTVGSVTDTTDRVSKFSNGGKLIDILAPGESILAAGIRMSGTSQATPHVAGAIAVLKGKHVLPKESNNDIIKVLKENAPIVTDYRTGMRFPRLDLLESIKLAEDSKERPLEWTVLPKNKQILNQESDIPSLMFEAFDPNGRNISYKVKRNTCPFKLEEKKLDNVFVLNGSLDKTNKKSCFISLLASTIKKESSLATIQFVINPLKEDVKPIQWVDTPESLSFEVYEGEKIKELFFKAVDPNGDELNYKVVSNGQCSWRLFFDKKKDGVALFGSVPLNPKIKNCTILIHSFTKDKSVEPLKIQFRSKKMERPLVWKKRPPMFYKVEAGAFIPEILMEAMDPNGQKISYKMINSTCPWDFKLKNSQNILSLRGEVPSSAKMKRCSVQMMPFTKEKEGETLTLDFSIKLMGKKPTLRWSYVDGSFYQEIYKGEGTQFIKMKASSSNNTKIRYTVKKSCSLKLNYKLRNNILFFKAHSSLDQKAETCELLFKAHSKGTKSIYKRMIVKVLVKKVWHVEVREYFIIIFKRINNFFS